MYDVEFTVMYRNEPKIEMWARLVQLVEHQTYKQGVVGSIPALANDVSDLSTYVIFKL